VAAFCGTAQSQSAGLNQYRSDPAGRVDRDAPAPDLSGQALSKHLDGFLGGRVWHQAGRQNTLAQARADHDNATATLMYFVRRQSDRAKRRKRPSRFEQRWRP